MADTKTDGPYRFGARRFAQATAVEGPGGCVVNEAYIISTLNAQHARIRELKAVLTEALEWEQEYLEALRAEVATYGNRAFQHRDNVVIRQLEPAIQKAKELLAND